MKWCLRHCRVFEGTEWTCCHATELNERLDCCCHLESLENELCPETVEEWEKTVCVVELPPPWTQKSPEEVV